jgi:hypothetical protein
MLKTIDTECIIANLLLYNEKITIRDLNNIRQSLEKASDYNIYVDVTSNSVVWATNQYYNLFEFKNDIFLKKKKLTKDLVNNYFNYLVPADFLETFENIIYNYKTEE